MDLVIICDSKDLMIINLDSSKYWNCLAKYNPFKNVWKDALFIIHFLGEWIEIAMMMMHIHKNKDILHENYWILKYCFRIYEKLHRKNKCVCKYQLHSTYLGVYEEDRWTARAYILLKINWLNSEMCVKKDKDMRGLLISLCFMFSKLFEWIFLDYFFLIFNPTYHSPSMKKAIKYQPIPHLSICRWKLRVIPKLIKVLIGLKRKSVSKGKSISHTLSFSPAKQKL